VFGILEFRDVLVLGFLEEGGSTVVYNLHHIHVCWHLLYGIHILRRNHKIRMRRLSLHSYNSLLIL